MRPDSPIDPLPGLPVLSRVIATQMLQGTPAARKVIAELSPDERAQFNREVVVFNAAIVKMTDGMRQAMESLSVAMGRVVVALRPLADALDRDRVPARVPPGRNSCL